MKPFVLNFGKFALLQAAIAIFIFFIYTKKYPHSQQFLAATVDKHQRLQTEPSPRLLLVGGSSVAFGIDSEEFVRRTPLHPVNLGLHAALGLPYMLAEAEANVRAGDVVVLSPEYHQVTAYKGDTEYLLQLIECRPANARHLPWAQIRDILDGGLLVRLGTIVRSVLGKPLKLFKFDLIKDRGFYQRKDFNAYGDLLISRDRYSGPLREARFLFKANTNRVMPAIARLNKFQEHCVARGAQVFYSYPPLVAPAFQKSSNELATLDALFAQHLRIKRLDRPTDAVYGQTNFLDTVYHLTSEGAKQRSAFLAGRLAEALAGKPLAARQPDP